MNDTVHTTVLGEGRLTWPAGERRSDRYGCVALMLDGDSETEPSGFVSMDKAPVGRSGRLVATVQETRDSTHIGDLFRGFSPGGAVVGDDIALGTGELFREQRGDMPTVGVRPDDGRDSDWLDPLALYKCHEQTVRLRFEEPA